MAERGSSGADFFRSGGNGPFLYGCVHFVGEKPESASGSGALPGADLGIYGGKGSILCPDFTGRRGSVGLFCRLWTAAAGLGACGNAVWLPAVFIAGNGRSLGHKQSEPISACDGPHRDDMLRPSGAVPSGS